MIKEIVAMGLVIISLIPMIQTQAQNETEADDWSDGGWINNETDDWNYDGHLNETEDDGYDWADCDVENETVDCGGGYSCLLSEPPVCDGEFN